MTATSIGPPSTDDLISIGVEVLGDCVVLTAVGEIDSSSAPEFKAALDDALERQPAELSIDLCGVTFLDSAGLCVLAVAHRRTVEAGVRLRVRAAGRAVVRPLQITGLFDLLRVEQERTGPA